MSRTLLSALLVALVAAQGGRRRMPSFLKDVRARAFFAKNNPNRACPRQRRAPSRPAAGPPSIRRRCRAVAAAAATAAPAHPPRSAPPAHRRLCACACAADLPSGAAVQSAATAAADAISLVVAVANDGERPVNVSFVSGFLANPMYEPDPRASLFNFSALSLSDGVVEPGRETAVEWRMAMPYTQGETLEAPLMVTVFFYDARAGGHVGLPVYNETVRIVPRASAAWEPRRLMPYVVAAVFVVLSAILFFQVIAARPHLGAGSAAAKAGGGEREAAEENIASIVPPVARARGAAKA